MEAIENYLKGLYEAYEAFQADYKQLHKRSKMHNKEAVSEYYLRWRDKMRAEIRKTEKKIMETASCSPCVRQDRHCERSEAISFITETASFLAVTNNSNMSHNL